MLLRILTVNGLTGHDQNAINQRYPFALLRHRVLSGWYLTLLGV